MSWFGGGGCHSWLDVILCLLSNSRCTCYWGTALLLFALLPHSSHKVNCWNDLYLRKTSETLKSWQYCQHGETTNTHSMSDSILILIFVVEQWKSPRDGIRLCDMSASQSIKYCWILASHWTMCGWNVSLNTKSNYREKYSCQIKIPVKRKTGTWCPRIQWKNKY